MPRPGFVQRSQSPDLLAAARRIDQMRLRQRRDIGQRRRRRLFEKCRLRHSTRRGPAAIEQIISERLSSDRSNLERVRRQLELLHDVILALRDRDRVIEAQRTERRRPDQADADRSADHVGLVCKTSAASARFWPLTRPLISPVAAQDVGPCNPRATRHRHTPRPSGRLPSAGTRTASAIRPKRPNIWCRPARRPQYTGRVDIARTDAVRREAADQVRAHLELVEHAQAAVADLVEHAAPGRGPARRYRPPAGSNTSRRSPTSDSSRRRRRRRNPA